MCSNTIPDDDEKCTLVTHFKDTETATILKIVADNNADQNLLRVMHPISACGGISFTRALSKVDTRRKHTISFAPQRFITWVELYLFEMRQLQ